MIRRSNADPLGMSRLMIAVDYLPKCNICNMSTEIIEGDFLEEGIQY